jgi:hypothetical protein
VHCPPGSAGLPPGHCAAASPTVRTNRASEIIKQVVIRKAIVLPGNATNEASLIPLMVKGLGAHNENRNNHSEEQPNLLHRVDDKLRWHTQAD